MPRVVFVLFFFIVALLSRSAFCQVDELIQKLTKGSEAEQVAAARALGRERADAASAIPALVKGAKSTDVRLRRASVLALGSIGTKSGPVIAVLRSRLNDNEAAIRACAAHALGQLDAKQAVPQLIAAAVDADAIVRREVRDALRAINAPAEETLPLWIKTLEDSDPQVVLTAIQTLAELGADAVPSLKKVIQNESACYWACLAAAEIGPEAKALVPDLVKVLEHEDPEVRLQALIALGEIGPDAASAQPAVLALLEREKLESVRYGIAFVLKHMGDSPEAKTALLKLFKSEDEGLRAVAAWSLLTLDPTDKDGTLRKSIAAALRSEKPEVKQIAIKALRELPGEAKDADPEVIKAFVAALNDSSPEVVGQVMDALAARGAGAVPGVIRSLKQADARPYAVQIAIRLGPLAKDAVPALIESLNATRGDELQQEINFALASIGPDAAPATTALIRTLEESQHEEVRYSACYALGKIGPGAAAAKAALAKHVKSEADTFLQFASVWALVRILPDNAEVTRVALPLLVRALDDERDHVRAEAALSLGDMGAAAKNAVKKLRAVQDRDPSPAVREAAGEAVKKLSTGV